MGIRRGCAVRYIHTRRVGASAARNAGIECAKCDLLVFCDDDMYAAPDWLGNLVQALVEAGPRGVVTGRVLPAAAEAPGGAAPSIKADEDAAVYRGRIGKDVLYTGNMAAHRAVFAEVGLFDERLGPGTAFPSAEDNDLGFRLLEKGCSIHYTPGAILYHRAWRTGREQLALRWRYGVGRGAYYARHMRLWDGYMPGRLGRDIGVNLAAMLASLPRDGRKSLGHCLLILGILYGAVRWKITDERPARHG
jgi:GT2 family glycosyltransferase